MRSMFGKFPGFVLAALLILAFSSASAFATVSNASVNVVGISGAITTTATLSLTWNDSTGVLTVVLQNTSAAVTTASAGAFGLNLPTTGGLAYVGGSFTSTDPDFNVLSNPNGLNANGYGNFDFGASTGNDLSGPGTPSEGIQPGGSATFTFTFTGTLTSVTASSFLAALSSIPPGNSPQNAVVRFTGLDNGGSTFAVPEPTSLLSLGTGLLCIALTARRFRKKG